ncbi:site-specific integrase [Colwellia sp. 12G3]|uniref:site-specific integrase n=1 Tax=Colwellia sp. 12G3 TaxID=2058299 RepID=UPI0012FF0472|nr:site-specific integrase [Colwellia sp. 12G3]
MKSSNIPHLYIRNGIYYYRNNSVWKSLRTRCKKEAFNLLIKCLYGTMSGVADKSTNQVVSCDAKAPKPQSSAAVASAPKISVLINAYLKENGDRWSVREYTRIENTLKLLPRSSITKEKAIQLKQSLLQSKTVATFNRYLKYFNAFYRWLISNNADVTINPFDGLKVIEKRTSSASKRKAYTKEQLDVLFKFADKYGNKSIQYWLIMIGRYTGARMNEICQLKPSDITAEAIHIRGDVLKTDNAKRVIPTHPKLIERGLLEWVGHCTKDRLFHEWRPVRGSYSHAGSRWFSRNNPFKSGVKGEKADVDFHSLRHTVATELKQAGVPSQYAAQILGHSNGNITYDRYGKSINIASLMEAVLCIE